MILDIPQFSLKKGSQTLLTGKSGEGKSTLIHLLAGFIQSKSGGNYFFEGRDVSTISESDWDELRSHNIGLVFQHYPMLRGFDLLDNLLIPMGIAGNIDKKRALTLLKQVGLEHRLHHRPSQLSAGQRQRVSIVRALINRPALVLADEPTAHLDPESGETALKLLKQLATECETTLLMVSHDKKLIPEFDDHLKLGEFNRQTQSLST